MCKQSRLIPSHCPAYRWVRRTTSGARIRAEKHDGAAHAGAGVAGRRGQEVRTLIRCPAPCVLLPRPACMASRSWWSFQHDGGSEHLACRDGHMHVACRWVEQKKKFTEEEAEGYAERAACPKPPPMPGCCAPQPCMTPCNCAHICIRTKACPLAGARLEGGRERVQRRPLHAAREAGRHLGRILAAVIGSTTVRVVLVGCIEPSLPEGDMPVESGCALLAIVAQD